MRAHRCYFIYITVIAKVISDKKITAPPHFVLSMLQLVGGCRQHQVNTLYLPQKHKI